MGFRQYTINKGDKHVSKLFFKPFYNLTRMRYEVMFSSATCPEHNDDDAKYINRLFGMTYFGFFNMDSAFFGWKLLHGVVEIFACTNHNGTIKTNKLASVSINQVFSFTIKSLSDCFTFSIFDSNNMVICFHKMFKQSDNKLGFENSLLVTNPSGASSDIHVFMNRKY